MTATPPQSKSQTLVLSHRGYHVHAPENTVEAFERAWRLGVDGIETDVRLSADGVPVLFHDRLAPGGRPVASLPARELSAAAGYEVPELNAVLARWPGRFWNLEVKVPEALDATLAAVASGDAGKVLITSFWHPVVEEALNRMAVDCGVIVAHRPRDARTFLASLPQGDLGRLTTVVWYLEFLDPEILQAVADAGLRNAVYGPATPDEHRTLRHWPVHAVITDRPEFARDPVAAVA